MELTRQLIEDQLKEAREQLMLEEDKAAAAQAMRLKWKGIVEFCVQILHLTQPELAVKELNDKDLE